ALELGGRHRSGERKMAGAVLVLGTQVEQNDFALAGAREELALVEGAQLFAIGEVFARHVAHLRQPLLAERAESQPELTNGRMRDAVEDELPFAPRLDQPRGFQRLQVRARIADGESSLIGEYLDGFFSLAEEVENLEPLGARDCRPNPGELLVEGVFES